MILRAVRESNTAMLETTDQVRISRSTAYDGTNGEEIIAQFSAATFISDTGTVLAYSDETGTYEVPVGDRVFWSSTEIVDSTGPDFLPFPWRLWPVYTFVTVTGSAAVPASLLGGEQTITVDLAPVAGGEGAVLSGTVYTPLVSLRGDPGVLAGHSIITDGVTVVSSTQVDVVVQSGVGSLADGTAWVVAQQLQEV